MPVTGILGDLYRGITVMHINSRLMSHQCLELYQSETIECSYPRASQALVAYIPHHWNEKKLLKLRLNFLSLYLLACFIILSYAISRCYRLPPLDTSILLLAVSIGQGVPHNKIRSYGLFFMMVLLIFTFLNMFWSSAMSRYLTVPCSEKITKTIKEMVDEGAYPIATFEHYKHLLSHALEQDLFLALSKRLVIVPEIQDHANNIRDARTCHNKGYIELKTYAVHMHREDYLSGRKCYTILPEALMPGWKIYSFSFGSPFLPEMNKVLSWMASAGLDEFYWREFPLDIDKEFYTARFYTLGYRFVEVAFYILFGGWAAGALVFICEQTNGRFVKKCVLWCSCWLYGFAARR
ncbi:uncharacterized protein LOC126746334 [Anthonomus grandis grandis]|uniref:uncharacterized protein LOC126746334 n=1 Tax=Anthonomus grandis grandis TaxID=2921223 RepID=UPI002165F4EE|nr:uncharacterized protein LOC126746334 [Anthonomus grandis grandis]